ncbi:MAG: DUF5906 domain-containing protein [Fusobacteriaceae bacterium]
MEKFIEHMRSLNIDYRIGKDKAIKEKGWNKEEVRISNLNLKGEYIGMIFKEKGLFVGGKMVVCIDIDAKTAYGNTREDQIELFKSVCNILGLDPFYQGIEQTMNGGYHIYVALDPTESIGLKNSSVIVEMMEDGKKAKKEIEVFNAGRYIVNAPSVGYRANDSFIRFDKLVEISLENLENLKTLSCKIETCKNYEDVEFNTGKTDTYLNKAYSNIPELKSFKNGKWPGYNLVKEEVFRFYIALNQEEEFLKVIQNNWEKHYHSWKEFPKKYLEVTEGNRAPSKNSQHVTWLKSVGALKATSKKDALKDDMIGIFESIAGKSTISLGDSIFIYNGRSYEWLNPLEYDVAIYRKYQTNFNKLLNKEEIGELVHHFRMFLRCSAEEYNPADKTRCVSKVPLAFKNGTLYITENSIEFKESFWCHSDRCFIEFTIDYSKECSRPYLNDWVEARFGTSLKKDFFQMCIGDLFATEANTDIHAYFWGGAGIGKSTVSSLLQSITTRGTIDFMKLDKIKDKFSRVKTLRTPILIADEASERSIPESEYKSTISREPDDYEMKNVQNFNGQPIAKFLTFANIVPQIKMDAGVKRRLCVLEVTDKKIHMNLSELEFSEKLGECKNEVINFIVEGIQKCFALKWRLSNFYQTNFEDEKRNMIESNDNFSYFIDKCFVRSSEIVNKEDVVTSMDAFKIYNQFLSTLDGTAMQRMTVTKFGTKIKELGFERVSLKKDKKVIKVYKGLIHSSLSKELLHDFY